MAAQQPIAFQNPLPSCPKCSAGPSAVSGKYYPAGKVYDGAPELIALACGMCGYGTCGQFPWLMNVQTPG